MGKHHPHDAYDKYTGNTENQVAVDAPISQKFGNLQHAYEEGFSASHGLRGQTFATNGKVKRPETQDRSSIDRVPKTIEEENPGLADN